MTRSFWFKDRFVDFTGQGIWTDVAGQFSLAIKSHRTLAIFGLTHRQFVYEIFKRLLSWRLCFSSLIRPNYMAELVRVGTYMVRLYCVERYAKM